MGNKIMTKSIFSFCILHSAFCIVSAVAAPAATAETGAPATFAAAKKAINDAANALDKAKKPFTQCVAQFEKMRETEPYATNAALKAEINGKILSWCLLPGWTMLKRYDRGTCTEKATELCRAVLASDDYAPLDKERYAQTLAGLLAGERDFAGAEQVARDHLARVLALQPANRNAECRAWLLLADVFRWQDRADDRVDAIEKARLANKGDGTRIGTAKALSLGGLGDRVEAWWRDLADPFAEASYFAEKNPARCRAFARDYVLAETNALGRRCELAFAYFLKEDSPEALEALRAIGRHNLSRTGSWTLKRDVVSLFQHGAYRHFADVLEALGAASTNAPKVLLETPVRRMYVISLGAIGRKADGAAFARAHEADAGNKPLDTLRYQVYAAILSGNDALPVIEASPCSPKDKVAATLSAARQCQVWEMTEEAERYAAAYERHFAPPPKRVAKVVWSDRPVTHFPDWRALLPKLETQLCDLKFDASLDFLETDVATGREKVVFEEGAKPVRMSFTAVADRNALHLFLRVEDSEARRVETGFKGGVTTEMYFAPGVDQPYVCFGSNPRDGITFDFQTSYSNADHKRLDRTAAKGAHFRSETDFTDDDYVLHISFPWDDFYQKLPSPNAAWRFECIAWCPDGAYTWGGSIGIHNASRWGTLAIDLTPAQLTEIRRGILLRTAKGGWRGCQYPHGITLDYFEKWADDEIGDPGFYRECLAPLEEELAGYAARIKPEMSDADVNEIYEKALVRMKGLKYEIDRLRREYLARQLTD